MAGVIRPLLVILLNLPELLSSPQPVFRPEGGELQLGYCFGSDYITAYRSGPDGDLLLGNSSQGSEPPRDSSSPVVDMRGRVTTINISELLGMEIHSLRTSDSGVYRWECWQDGHRVNHMEHRLSVCRQEAGSQEIALLPGGGADLRCDHGLDGRGRTVRWYREAEASKTRTIFLDTGLSQGLLSDDLRDLVEVRDAGFSLHVASEAVINSRFYYCQVMDGEQCLSFKKMVSKQRDPQPIYRSVGEAVLLPCLSQNLNQEQVVWHTPQGHVNQTSEPNDAAGGPREQMYAVDGSRSGNYSLAIPSLSRTHSGEYKCLSRSFVTEYALYVCPQRAPITASFSHGNGAVLNCGPGLEDSSRVVWYRRSGLQRDLLIADSDDSSQPVPEELSGRVSLSNSSLLLFNLSQADSGEYWCVVLNDYDYMDVIDDTISANDLESDNPGSEDYPESEYYSDSEEPQGSDGPSDSSLGEDDDVLGDQCISRQVTILTCTTKRNKEDSPLDSTVYTVTAVIVGVVIVGIVGAVIAVLWKTRIRTAQGHGDGHHRRQAGEGQDSEETALSDRLAPVDNHP